MLPSIGLFKSIPCPLYPNCKRNPCFYSHSETRSSTIKDRPTVKRQKVTPAPKAKSIEPVKAIGKPDLKDEGNRVTPLIPVKAASSSTSSTAKVPAISARAARMAATPPPPPRSGQTAEASTLKTVKRVAHTPTFKSKPTGPPIIAPTAKSSIPLKVRQLIATKLFDNYARIYNPILSTNPTLATEHAKREELKIHDSTSNEAGYKQMAMSTLMQLKKRPVSTGVEDIGLADEWVDPATAKAEASRLYERALEHIVPMDLLKQLEYPLPDLLLLPVEEPPAMVGTIHECDRCKKEYLVKDVLDKEDTDKCVYHPGRMKVMKVDGLKEKVYRCCEDALGSVGCSRGPHVYKDTELSMLHKKTPYMPTPPRNPKSTTCQNLVALDCEMGYTTAGMELIRLTAVDQYMNVLLDELVIPSNMIIDLNTHYSGIKTLAGAKYDLPSLRQELFKYIDQDTIIVGHGLENDMNALRIIHTNIIDTVALYPHKSGLPYRNSLRILTSGVLKKFIQTGSDGHDSFEDARVCIELLEAYLKCLSLSFFQIHHFFFLCRYYGNSSYFYIPSQCIIA